MWMCFHRKCHDESTAEANAPCPHSGCPTDIQESYTHTSAFTDFRYRPESVLPREGSRTSAATASMLAQVSKELATQLLPKTLVCLFVNVQKYIHTWCGERWGFACARVWHEQSLTSGTLNLGFFSMSRSSTNGNPCPWHTFLNDFLMTVICPTYEPLRLSWRLSMCKL